MVWLYLLGVFGCLVRGFSVDAAGSSFTADKFCQLPGHPRRSLHYLEDTSPFFDASVNAFTVDVNEPRLWPRVMKAHLNFCQRWRFQGRPVEQPCGPQQGICIVEKAPGSIEKMGTNFSRSFWHEGLSVGQFTSPSVPDAGGSLRLTLSNGSPTCRNNKNETVPFESTIHFFCDTRPSMLYHALINPCHLYFLWSTYQACPLTDQETYMDIPYQNACWVKVIGQDELVDIKKEKGYHHSTLVSHAINVNEEHVEIQVVLCPAPNIVWTHCASGAGFCLASTRSEEGIRVIESIPPPPVMALDPYDQILNVTYEGTQANYTVSIRCSSKSPLQLLPEGNKGYLSSKETDGSKHVVIEAISDAACIKKVPSCIANRQDEQYELDNLPHVPKMMKIREGNMTHFVSVCGPLPQVWANQCGSDTVNICSVKDGDSQGTILGSPNTARIETLKQYDEPISISYAETSRCSAKDGLFWSHVILKCNPGEVGKLTQQPDQLVGQSKCLKVFEIQSRDFCHEDHMTALGCQATSKTVQSRYDLRVLDFGQDDSKGKPYQMDQGKFGNYTLEFLPCGLRKFECGDGKSNLTSFCLALNDEELTKISIHPVGPPKVDILWIGRLRLLYMTSTPCAVYPKSNYTIEFELTCTFSNDIFKPMVFGGSCYLVVVADTSLACPDYWDSKCNPWENEDNEAYDLTKLNHAEKYYSLELQEPQVDFYLNFCSLHESQMCMVSHFLCMKTLNGELIGLAQYENRTVSLVQPKTGSLDSPDPMVYLSIESNPPRTNCPPDIRSFDRKSIVKVVITIMCHHESTESPLKLEEYSDCTLYLKFEDLQACSALKIHVGPSYLGAILWTTAILFVLAAVLAVGVWWYYRGHRWYRIMNLRYTLTNLRSEDFLIQ